MIFECDPVVCPVCDQSGVPILSVSLPSITSSLLDPRDATNHLENYPADLYRCRNCLHGWLMTNSVIDYADRARATKFGYEKTSTKNPPIAIIGSEAGVQSQLRTLEIGANDGSFLKQLMCAGVSRDVLAVEPNNLLTQLIERRGIPCLTEYFDRDLAIRIKEEYGQFDLIICRHVLEHVSDLNDFLLGCVDLLPSNGLIYFEFPNSDLIFKHGYFWEIWEEHLHYFSPHSAEVLLKNAGLEIHTIQHIPDRGSENICILGGISTAQTSKHQTAQELIGRKMSRFFSVDLKTLISNIRENLLGSSLVIIGASHYQRNFVTYLGLGSQCQGWLDDDKAKAGLLPIVPGNRALVTGLDEYFFTSKELSSVIVINGLFGHPNVREKLNKYENRSIEIVDFTSLVV